MAIKNVFFKKKKFSISYSLINLENKNSIRKHYFFMVGEVIKKLCKNHLARY